MISDKISSFKPFHYRFLSYDGKTYDVSFTCPKCGSHSCVKLSYDGLTDDFCFWSGNYMCYNCGISVHHGKEFNYYHDCFHKLRVSLVVQLTFNF